MIRGIEDYVVTRKDVAGIVGCEHIGDSLDPGPASDLFERSQRCGRLRYRLVGILLEKEGLTMEIRFADTVSVEDGECTDPAPNQRLRQRSSNASTANQQDS